ASLFYLTGLSKNIVGMIPYEINYLEMYSSMELIQYYGGSYNIKFYIFNTGFLILFLFFYYNYPIVKSNGVFNCLLNIYILFSSVFLTFGYIAFADRLASYSWFIIPIIVAMIIKNVNLKVSGVVTLVGILIIGAFTTPLVRTLVNYYY